MPPFSIVFVIHDEQDDAVFAGGVGQWLQCIVVTIIRVITSLEAVSMQKLHGHAVLVKPTIVKAARGDPILNVACNIVCNGKRFFGIQGWAMASVHLRIHHTFLNP